VLNITGAELELVQEVLGVGGQGSGEVLFDDEHLSQIIAVNDPLRRSKAAGVLAQGLFYGVLVAEHAGAGNLSVILNPYNPAGNDPDAVFNDYPSPVGAEFDVWILRTSLRRSAGAGTLDGAVLAMGPIASAQGWGLDNSGDEVQSTQNFPLARWTGLDTGGQVHWGITGDGKVMAKPNIRMPRGGWNLRFYSTAGTADATFICSVLTGVFPSSLGQDVVT